MDSNGNSKRWKLYKKIDMNIWNKEDGEYNVHIYIVDGNGNQYNVAQKVVEIK